jgi:hypothetical protein
MNSCRKLVNSVLWILICIGSGLDPGLWIQIWEGQEEK